MTNWLQLLISIIGMIAPAAVMYGSLKERIKMLEKRADLSEDVKERLAAIETKLDFLTKK